MPYAFLPHVPRPDVTVDIVVLTLLDGRLHVLLVERGRPPFVGQLALPGGFLHVGSGGEGGEALDEAAARELVEETGLSRAQVFLSQLGAFGAPRRDPRRRVVTVAYMALVRSDVAPFVRGGSDARAARWLPVDEARGRLAFDHERILDAALARAAAHVARGELALQLAPTTFTLAELREVHEALIGHALDKANFRRAAQRLIDDGKIVAAPGKRVTGRRPARVYRAADAVEDRR